MNADEHQTGANTWVFECTENSLERRFLDVICAICVICGSVLTVFTHHLVPGNETAPSGEGAALGRK